MPANPNRVITSEEDIISFWSNTKFAIPAEVANVELLMAFIMTRSDENLMTPERTLEVSFQV